MLDRVKVSYTVEVHGKAKDYTEVMLITKFPAYDFTQAMDTVLNRLTQKHGWTAESIVKFSYEKMAYPVEEVLCIKEVVMDYTGQTAFFEGNKYPIARNGIYIDAEDEQGEQHGIGPENDEFFKEHFVLVKEGE